MNELSKAIQQIEREGGFGSFEVVKVTRRKAPTGRNYPAALEKETAKFADRLAGETAIQGLKDGPVTARTTDFMGNEIVVTVSRA